MADEVATLRSYLEHSPADPGPIAENLVGWITTADNFLCARCAGRLMVRGCPLPLRTAVWRFAVVHHTDCVCCAEVKS
jgi:hypothetical protein